MNRDPDTDEPMRDEYDFSGGTRGRFASRFTARERRELYESAAAADMKTWWTDAIRFTQRVERELFAYFVLVERLPQAHASERAARCMATGELGDATRGRVPGLPPARLASLSRERSWLFHRSGIESEAAFDSLAVAVRLAERFQAITEEATAVAQTLRDAIERSLASQGLAPAEIERRTGEAEAWWRAA